MEVTYRTATPGSRGRQPQPTNAGTGALSELWSSVVGSGRQPMYRQAERTAESVPRSRSQSFAATPQYRTSTAGEEECVLELPDCLENDVVVDIGDCEIVW